jgi:hypothetical protein
MAVNNPTPGAETDATSTQESAPKSSWFRDAISALSGGKHTRTDNVQNADTESKTDEQPSEKSDDGKEGTQEETASSDGEQKPFFVAQTQQELDAAIARKVQSEVDRIRERDRRRELRRTDPDKYAEEDEQREQTQEEINAEIAKQGPLLKEFGTQYDTAILDPVKSLLTDAEVKALIPKDGILGFEGRSKFVQDAIKTYTARIKEETRKELLKDERFRKQVAHEALGGSDEDVELEPVRTASNGASRPNDMNTIIRNLRYSRGR